ncbi:hypothetical protein LCGC14_0691700 [marine sediment metagenome]|uniref:Phage tail tape measure protein domain-containing protein n=1 Tax=marine sediment metagenome TaxID=412755 RepID=A0A0F9T6F0_9ZZZZ
MTVLAVARIVLTGDTIALTKSLHGASAAMEQAGRRMTKIGKSLTTKVTLPIIAIGGVSVKMAATFDASMRKIVGLVGVQRDVVDGWRDDVRKLAVQYGSSANEAAEALFFITSAGLRGSDAMEALEASLKGTAAGMGQTATLADAATSAMNAYGAANVSAERAVEILTAAVRAGKLETAALAPVIGRLLPTASAMKIGFAEIAGILAVFSRTGLQAAEGATSLNSVMTTLLKPSQLATEALAEVGLTMAQLRETAAGPQGLIGVMRLLADTFADDDEKLTAIIPNIRAFRGVMNVLAQDADIVDQVMSDVANSQGILSEAFIASMGPLFRMRRAWEQFKELLLSVGFAIIPVIVPIFVKMGKAFDVVAHEIGNMSTTTKTAGVALVGAAAAIGPVLVGLGSAVLVMKALGVATLTVTTRLFGLSAVMGAGSILLVALGLTAAAMLKVKLAAIEMEASTLRATDSIKAGFADLEPEAAARKVARLNMVIKTMEGDVDNLRTQAVMAQAAMVGVADATATQATPAFRESADSLLAEADAIEETIARTKAFRTALQAVANTAVETAKVVDKGAGGGTAPAAWMVAAKEAMELLSASLRETVVLNELMGESFDLPAAQAEAYEAAIVSMVEAGVDLDVAVGQNGENLRVLTERYLVLAAGVDEAEKKTNALTAAQEDAKRIIEGIRTPTEQYDATVANLQKHLDATLLTQVEFDRAVGLAKTTLAEATASGLEWGETMERASAHALDSFIQFATTAGGEFSDFVNGVIRDLVRMAAKMAITGAFKSLTASPIPELAHGGFLPGGSLGLVGEQGPELVQAGRQGVTVQPMSGLVAAGAADTGGNIRLAVTIQANDAKSFKEMVEAHPDVVTAPVMQALARGQNLRRRLQG